MLSSIKGFKLELTDFGAYFITPGSKRVAVEFGAVLQDETRRRVAGSGAHLHVVSGRWRPR